MKFKSMKRFGSILMAGVMALSLVVPAFAEAAATPNQTVVAGSYVAVPISVLVPTTGSAQINPYGLPVTVSATADGDPISITNQQITNVPMYIGNFGTVALDVDATLAVLPKGSVKIQGVALTNAEVGKEINVELEVVGLDNAAYAKAIDNEALIFDLHEAYADEDTWDNATSLTAPAAASPTATVTPAKSADNTTPMATLGAATVNGEVITYGDDSIALFRLAGEMNEEPVKSASGGGTEEDPWVEADGFTATIVFKFKPHTAAPAAPSVTASMTGTPAAGGSVTLNAAISNIDASKNPTYSWAVTTDTDSIVDSFSDSTAAAQTVNIAAGATTGQSATLTVTVTYDDQGSGDATVTDTVTITMP